LLRWIFATNDAIRWRPPDRNNADAIFVYFEVNGKN
jgi:hypothetical protein